MDRQVDGRRCSFRPLDIIPSFRIFQRVTSVKRIVIIEDDVDSAEMLSMLLELQGHVVKCAKSAVEGIQLVQTLQPDVVITDLGLPDMNGSDLVSALVKIGTLTASRVIALTGRNDQGLRNDILEAGASNYLLKGEDVSKLLEIVGT
jgi:CheY-like chemotaxis protein